MRNKSQYKNNIIDLVILYFKYRNCYNQGFQKYYYFKNLIKHITNLDDLTFIRRIFEELLLKKIIEKKIICSSVRYRFNPYRKESINSPPYILTFN
tara:strand:+ start:714 stop:1001 length:288 start_codon:yes stop_codon:yes gene_type:complete